MIVRLRTEELLVCPLCRSADTENWRSGCRDWQRPEAPDLFSFRRCCSCDVRFLVNRPHPSELEKIYFAGYAPHRQTADKDSGQLEVLPPLLVLALRAMNAGLSFVPRVRLARALKRVYTPTRRSATLLDFGCGAPTFLDAARRSGWNTIGVDVSARVVSAVRERGHEGFTTDDFARYVPDGSLACVRMNHVVEHLNDPVATLAQLRTKMETGGYLHLATPNPVGVGARVFGRHWLGLDPPRHTILFPPDVIRRLLTRLGLVVEALLHEPAAKDLARSWGIRRWTQGRIGPAEIPRLATDPLGLALSSPAAALTSFLSASDRYHVIARAWA